MTASFESPSTRLRTGLRASGGDKLYGNIGDLDHLRENLRTHCISEGIEQMGIEDYPDFLAERRRLMAQKIRKYFAAL